MVEFEYYDPHGPPIVEVQLIDPDSGDLIEKKFRPHSKKVGLSLKTVGVMALQKISEGKIRDKALLKETGMGLSQITTLSEGFYPGDPCLGQALIYYLTPLNNFISSNDPGIIRALRLLDFG